MQQQMRSRFDHPEFRPNDGELLCHYLYKKVKGLPLPRGFVEKCDLQEPWETWEMYGGGMLGEDEDLYFFTQLKRKSGKGKRICGQIGSGTWQGEDGAKEIRERNEKVVGWRKRFRYEKKGSDLRDNGGWIMHEYKMMGDCEEVVLCRIRKNQVGAATQTTAGGKKRKITKATEEQLMQLPVAVAVAHHDDLFADEVHYLFPSSSTVSFSDDDNLSSIL